jgi:hypothetical protein
MVNPDEEAIVRCETTAGNVTMKMTRVRLMRAGKAMNCCGYSTYSRCSCTELLLTLSFSLVSLFIYLQTWSPNGYDRIVELFERNFFDESHLYRVVPNFLVQFGISYSEDKELQKFARTPIQDDPSHGMPFRKGLISYAGRFLCVC